MNTKIGMDTVTGAQVARTVQGMTGVLDLIEQQVITARLASLSPLNWGIAPGMPVLSPTGITIGAQVTKELANVQQNLAYLAAKLTEEARQQELVSNSLNPGDPGWFAPPPSSRRPDEIGLWEEEWDLVTGWGEGIDDFWEVVGNVWDTVSNVEFWVGLVTGAVEVVQQIDKWWNDVLDRGPKWLRPAFEFAFDALNRYGKFIPWVGTIFGGANTIVDWDNDNPWGNTRNIIGLVFDGVSFIPTPWTVGIGTIGGFVWDIFDSIWDEYDKGNWKWWWE